MLSQDAIACVVCATMEALCSEVGRGAGAVLVSEEALTANPDGLIACVAAQAVWSDLPILVLSRSGAESQKLTAVVPRLGNVTVVERPVRVTTLISMVRSALRARARQSQVRDHLDQSRRAEQERAVMLEREQAARSEAERASQMKDEFLATLSHELRTPLNAILGWSQLLATGSRDAEDVAEGLRTIARNARAQTQIIEDLLDMSRIISGKVRLDVQRIDLAPVIRAAVETVRPAAEAKGIRLHAVLDPLAHPVSGDPDRLQQVFWNLLTNAVKFTPREGRVQVLLERVNSHVEVSVIDTGEGISPDFLPHVFDRFRQADASTTRRHGGLGIGLAIVKQLVELHGGTVRVKSGGPGHGSTFSVSLPVTVIHPEPDSAPAVRRRHPAANSSDDATPNPCPSLAGVKVLVVDDEPDARALIKRLLGDCDAVVQTAGSAPEAMEMIQSGRPDVLVSDIGMAGEDGYSFIKRLRQLDATQGGRIPALALTAYSRSEDRTRAIAAGYQMHISKPVEPVELITMVASLAGRTV
jgi:signal transduction histidine kinase